MDTPTPTPTIKITNSAIIFMNNAAVDALHAGDLEKGFKILSQAFYSTIKDRHQTHNLTSAAGSSSSLEFCLQDCSRNLQRAVEKRNAMLSPPSDDSSQFLCLTFLRMEIPSDDESRDKVDQLCSCAVAWALGYNLSTIYAVMGALRASGGNMLFKKARRMLMPIKRQVLLHQSNSSFWTNLKLCILNNFICMQRECGMIDVALAVQAMEKLLVQSRRHLNPIDVKKFYLSVQFLNVCPSIAAAA